MYEQDLALNNLQWLICHNTKPNQTNIYCPDCLLSTYHREHIQIIPGAPLLWPSTTLKAFILWLR